MDLFFHFKYFRMAENFWNTEPEKKDKSENGKDKIYLLSVHPIKTYVHPVDYIPHSHV